MTAVAFSRSRTLSVAGLLLLLLLVACGEGEAPATSAEPSAAEPSTSEAGESTPASDAAESVTLTLTLLDGEVLEEGRGESQRKAQLAGSVSTDATVCALVRPPEFEDWLVQPPTNLEPNAEGFEWVSMAFLGTKDRGVGDLFEIKAIAEASPTICQPKNRVSEDDLDNVLATSETVKVLRLPDA